MASPAKLYQREMHNNVGFFATWLPSGTLEIGDIGVFENGRFRRTGSLGEFGVSTFNVREGEPQNMSYTGSAERKVAGTGKAEVAPMAAGAELSIRFTQQGGYVFEAEGVRHVEIADRMTLADFVMTLYGEKRWQKEWRIIDAVYQAASATILVSEDSSSEIVLNARAGLLPGTLPLSDPKLGLSVSSSSGKIMHVIAAAGLKPLYSCLQVRSHIFRDPTLEPVRGMARVPSDVLSRPAIEELLES